MNEQTLNSGDRVKVRVGRNLIEAEVVEVVSETTLTVRNLATGKAFTTARSRLVTEAPAPRRRSLTAIAREVLEAEGRPLSVTEILALAEQRGLFEPSDWGKTPGQTLYGAFVRLAKSPTGWVRKAEARGKWALTPRA